ncbi:hypothetical protein BJQ90_01381 [Arthrobacter sp. SO3]|nr:hypothetical protein [Arthrobacter sp. SO3]
MSAWRRHDSHLMPVFHERFEARWGQGTAPFFDPEAHEAPLPRAQWINVDTGAALAVVPIWTAEDSQHRSFGVFYLPPAGDIWVLRPGYTSYLDPRRMRPNSCRPCATTRSRRPSPTPRISCLGLKPRCIESAAALPGRWPPGTLTPVVARGMRCGLKSFNCRKLAEGIH